MTGGSEFARGVAVAADLAEQLGTLCETPGEQARLIVAALRAYAMGLRGEALRDSQPRAEATSGDRQTDGFPYS